MRRSGVGGGLIGSAARSEGVYQFSENASQRRPHVRAWYL